MYQPHIEDEIHENLKEASFSHVSRHFVFRVAFLVELRGKDLRMQMSSSAFEDTFRAKWKLIYL